jgi:hypothetical protein
MENDAITSRITEATTLLAKAMTAVETATLTSQKVTKLTTAAMLTLQNATTTVNTTTTQLNETTTTYKDAVLKATTQPQTTPLSVSTALTLNARIRAREGIKLRQILVDATNPGTQILAEVDNIGLAKKANEIIATMGAENTQSRQCKTTTQQRHPIRT